MPGDNSLSGKPLHLAQIISMVMAVGMAIFQMVTAYTGPLPAIQQRAIHLCFALVLIFLNFPIRRSDSSSIFDRILNAALIILAVISCLYLVIDYRALSFRVGRHTPTDFWIGAIGIVLVLEAARRTTGWALTSVAIGCLAYGLFGQYAPGVLQHRGYSLERLVTQLFMDPVDPVGVFGIALGVSASMVFVFILFGVFLMNTGAGELFLNTGKALFGRLRGGPAKMAAIASGLFGSVSGSASANVVVTGSITIPMMKRLGYQPAFAGAVEAAASTGGMIMPPIMGATAFLIADTLGIPYLAVVKAAAIPAILYYLSIYVAVDLEAGKLGLTGLRDEEVAGAKKAISSVVHMVVPLLILIYMIVVKHYSPTYAAFWSIIATFAFSFLRSSTRLNLKKLIDTLVQGSLFRIS
jgi:TRAP transporter 4TM/12TM fusion protein